MFCGKCQSFWNGVTSQVQFGTSSVRWSGYSATVHNDFGSLRRSSDQGCPPCRTIVHAMTREGRPDVPIDTTVLFELDPQDGTDPVLRGELRTSQGHVFVKKFVIAAFSDYVEDDDLPSALNKCQTLKNQSTGSDSAIELARYWVNQCLSQHQRCGFSSSSPSFVPTRVLDLANGGIRLIATNGVDMADRRYLTLSHCWGKTQIITTTKATLNERHRGIRMSDLSQTFQDSVQAARKLGFRYLWIDSLCIIQDDPRDWEREAAQMCQVYSHSTFNIAAANASDGLMGCFVQRDALLRLPLSVKLRRGMTVLFTLYDLTYRIPDFQPAPPELEPPLYGRAWVFQEQLLSRRMLIFDGTEVSWKCLCGNGTERYPLGRATQQLEFHKSIRQGIAEDKEYFKENDFSRRNQLSEWCEAVMDYTNRGMTVATDRLIAISGVADAIQKKTNNRFLVGLWESELWMGLLWSIPPTTSRAVDHRAQSLRNDVAPSWSWISVNAPVEYPRAIRFPFLQPICSIGRVEVSGPPARKTGAMEIRGHTRTAYINSIYPQAFTKDPGCPVDMAYSCSDVGNEKFEYNGRRFHPNTYFIFSDQSPTGPDDANWQLMRGLWRPDEVIPPDTPITFLAIGQQHHDSRTATEDRPKDPLQVYTIGLIPSPESPNTYRRVGYAVWDDCAWYGYNCSAGMNYMPSKEAVQPVEQSWWSKVLDSVCCLTSEPDDPIEIAYPGEQRFHDHEYGDPSLPVLSKYNLERANVRTKTLQVV